jgi:hypothetical protein
LPVNEDNNARGPLKNNNIIIPTVNTMLVIVIDIFNMFTEKNILLPMHSDIQNKK